MPKDTKTQERKEEIGDNPDFQEEKEELIDMVKEIEAEASFEEAEEDGFIKKDIIEKVVNDMVKQMTIDHEINVLEQDIMVSQLEWFMAEFEDDYSDMLKLANKVSDEESKMEHFYFHYYDEEIVNNFKMLDLFRQILDMIMPNFTKIDIFSDSDLSNEDGYAYFIVYMTNIHDKYDGKFGKYWNILYKYDAKVVIEQLRDHIDLFATTDFLDKLRPPEGASEEEIMNFHAEVELESKIKVDNYFRFLWHVITWNLPKPLDLTIRNLPGPNVPLKMIVKAKTTKTLQEVY